jgi:bifunctional polynucleotide phosphatase/kinase
MSWTDFKSPKGQCVIFSNVTPTQNKIIGLGFDWTIVKPKELEFCVTSKNSWDYCYNMKKLYTYHKKGYITVIFASIYNINKKGHLSLDDFKAIIEKINNDLKIPLQVYLSIGYSILNKPMTGLWEIFLEFNCYSEDYINKHKSIYIGQEAGRIKNSFNKKDISSADYYFSKNIGIKFKTPEQFFNNNRKLMHLFRPLSFHPKYYIKRNLDNYQDKLVEYRISTMNKNGQHILLITGSPASGKSRICKKYLTNYVQINQDTLKTLAKCIKMAIENLDKGYNIVVDNTNRNAKVRSKWIELAQKYKIPIDCIYININKNMALHFNSYRNLCNPKNKIPDIAIHSYFSQMTEPHTDEGFRKIIVLKIDNNFDDKNIKNILQNYIRFKYDADNTLTPYTFIDKEPTMESESIDKSKSINQTEPNNKITSLDSVLSFFDD